jgi:hypothetical protein
VVSVAWRSAAQDGTEFNEESQPLADEEASSSADNLFDLIQELSPRDSLLTDDILSPPWEIADKWTCQPEHVLACRMDGCRQFAPGHYFSITHSEQSYERCAADECSSRRMEGFRSEQNYTMYTLAGVGYFVKMRNDGTEFVEVVTNPIRVETIQSFGSCNAVSDDQ